MAGANSQPPTPGGIEAVVGVVFGLVFAIAGVAIIGGLGMMSGGFGSPPPLFRLMATLIGIAFVAAGGGAVCKILQGLCGDTPEMPSTPEASAESEGKPATTPPPDVRYVCPRCGAPLADKADVSPHGDVKCGYCTTWFNIHQV